MCEICGSLLDEKVVSWLCIVEPDVIVLPRATNYWRKEQLLRSSEKYK